MKTDEKTIWIRCRLRGTVEQWNSSNSLYSIERIEREFAGIWLATKDGFCFEYCGDTLYPIKLCPSFILNKVDLDDGAYDFI